MRPIGRALITVTAVLAALAAMAGTAPGAPPPRLSIINTDTLTAAAKPGEDSAPVTMTVFNPGRAAVAVRMTFEAASSNGGDVHVASWSPKQITPGAQRVTVTLSGLQGLSGENADGQLVVRGGRVPIAHAVTVTPAPNPSADWPLVLALALGASAIIFGLIVWRIAGRYGQADPDRPILRSPAPGPDWSYASAASVLAGVGGLVGTVLGDVTLPTVPHEIAKDALVRMNLIFTVMVAIGPFVFYAFRRRRLEERWTEAGMTPKDMADQGLWGHTWLLMACYALTLVAVLGQVAALTLAGWEIAGAHAWPGVVVLLVGAGLEVCTFFYFAGVCNGQLAMDWAQLALKKCTPPDPGEAPLKHKDLPLPVVSNGPPATRDPRALLGR